MSIIVRGHLSTEIQGLVGAEAAETVEAMLEGTAKPASNRPAMIAGVVTMVLAAAGAFLERLQILSFLLTLLVSAVLFGLIFRVLPDVTLSNRDVALGAIVTAVLFAIGKQLIGLYIGWTAVASSYGAADSIVLLLWVYFSSQIVLIGAEFTRLYGERGRTPGRRTA